MLAHASRQPSPHLIAHVRRRNKNAEEDVLQNLRVVPADERFSRLVFNPKHEYTDHLIDVGAYRCPHCASESEFNTGTLRQHETDRARADLSTWGRACEATRALGAAWEWFFDLSCIGCGAPARVIYGHGGEFAMGCYKYQLLEVLETTSWAKGDEAPWPKRPRSGV